MELSKLKNELRLANEGLDQIHEAKENGEYEDLGAYNRDVENQAKGIERLETRIARLEKEEA